jgi:hypothetical protein
VIIIALVVGWLFLGFCGAALFWFFTEREVYPNSPELKVRLSDIWMFITLSACGPLSLVITIINVLLTLMARRFNEGKKRPDPIIFTFKRKVK